MSPHVLLNHQNSSIKTLKTIFDSYSKRTLERIYSRGKIEYKTWLSVTPQWAILMKYRTLGKKSQIMMTITDFGNRLKAIDLII